MSHLIVIGYPDEKTAQNVWEELVELERDYLVDLEDAAIITRDHKGKLHITTPAHHAVAWGSFSGLFWGVLIGLLFLFPLAPLVGFAGGIMRAALGGAENPGIKDYYKQLVQHMLEPGTSPILVIPPQSDLRQVRRGAAALRRDNPANLAFPRGGAAAHEDPARRGPEGTDLGAANGLRWGAGLRDLIVALAPSALTLPGRVMWLRTASSSLVTKRTSEQERWTDEDRQ